MRDAAPGCAHAKPSAVGASPLGGRHDIVQEIVNLRGSNAGGKRAGLRRNQRSLRCRRRA